MLDNCIESNDIEKLDMQSILNSNDTVDLSYKILPQKSDKKILKNSSCENQCNWSCPFQNCDKAYSGRASLRMHIKHKHTYGDEIKTNYPYSLSSVFTPNFGRGVDINKVVKKRTKIVKESITPTLRKCL